MPKPDIVHNAQPLAPFGTILLALIMALAGFFALSENLSAAGFPVNNPARYSIDPELNPLDALLWQAVVANDADAVRSALKLGANINVVVKPEKLRFLLPREYPPLPVAIQRGHTQLAALLIEAGADINFCSRFRVDIPVAVLEAVGTGNEEIFALLDKQGARIPLIQEGNFERPSLLQYAAAGGSQKIFDQLVAKGYALPASEKDQALLLQSAAEGSLELFTRLRDRFQLKLSEPQRLQLVRGASEEVLSHFYHEPDQQAQLEELLLTALTKGYSRMAREILHDHPQLWSTRMQSKLQQLIENNAETGQTMVSMLLETGHGELVRQFLDDLAFNIGQSADAKQLALLLEEGQLSQAEKARVRGLAVTGALFEMVRNHQDLPTPIKVPDAVLKDFCLEQLYRCQFAAAKTLDDYHDYDNGFCSLLLVEAYTDHGSPLYNLDKAESIVDDSRLRSADDQRRAFWFKWAETGNTHALVLLGNTLISSHYLNDRPFGRDMVVKSAEEGHAVAKRLIQEHGWRYKQKTDETP